MFELILNLSDEPIFRMTKIIYYLLFKLLVGIDLLNNLHELFILAFILEQI